MVPPGDERCEVLELEQRGFGVILPRRSRSSGKRKVMDAVSEPRPHPGEGPRKSTKGTRSRFPFLCLLRLFAANCLAVAPRQPALPSRVPAFLGVLLWPILRAGPGAEVSREKAQKAQNRKNPDSLFIAPSAGRCRRPTTGFPGHPAFARAAGCPGDSVAHPGLMKRSRPPPKDTIPPRLPHPSLSRPGTSHYSLSLTIT